MIERLEGSIFLTLPRNEMGDRRSGLPQVKEFFFDDDTFTGDAPGRRRSRVS
jgi:hypothetical protein